MKVRHLKHSLPLLLIALGLAALGGCKAELETGYKPKKLGVSEEERRAYYAPAFSPESQAGLKEGDSGKNKFHRAY